jgi:hypothetical protein
MTEQDAGMLPLLPPRPAPPYRCSTWLAARAPSRPGRGRRRPPEARSQLVGHDLDHRPRAVSSRPGPRCPGRQPRWLAWILRRPHGPGHGRLHGRSAAAWHQRGPAPMVRCTARTATSRPRRPSCPPGLAAARGAASDRVSAPHPQGLLGRVRGVYSDRVRCPLGQVSGVCCPPSAAGPMAGRAGSAPPAHRRGPQSAARRCGRGLQERLARPRRRAG